MPFAAAGARAPTALPAEAPVAADDATRAAAASLVLACLLLTQPGTAKNASNSMQRVCICHAGFPQSRCTWSSPPPPPPPNQPSHLRAARPELEPLVKVRSSAVMKTRAVVVLGPFVIELLAPEVDAAHAAVLAAHGRRARSGRRRDGRRRRSHGIRVPTVEVVDAAHDAPRRRRRRREGDGWRGRKGRPGRRLGAVGAFRTSAQTAYKEDECAATRRAAGQLA